MSDSDNDIVIMIKLIVMIGPVFVFLSDSVPLKSLQ